MKTKKITIEINDYSDLSKEEVIKTLLKLDSIIIEEKIKNGCLELITKRRIEAFEIYKKFKDKIELKIDFWYGSELDIDLMSHDQD